MTEKVKITRVSSTNKKKDGTVLRGKYGEFYRVGIQTEEYGEKWLNGFSNEPPTYEVGDTIEIETTTEEFNGEEQLKFRIPRKKDELESRIKKLEDAVFGADKDTPREVEENESDKPF